MLVPLLQNTCTNAAHSAAAHVMTTTSAFGSSAGVLNNCGACFPTAAQFTAAKSGVLLLDGRNFLEKSSALTAAESRSRAGCSASVVCDAFGVAVILDLHSERFSVTVTRNVATARRTRYFRRTSAVVRPLFVPDALAHPRSNFYPAMVPA